MEFLKNIILKKHQIKSVLFALLILNQTSAYSQSNVVSAGGSLSGAGGSASFSIGQLVFNRYTSVSHYVIEGLQQPFEIQTVAIYDQGPSENFDLSAFPNPTTDYLTLKVTNGKFEDCTYSIIDVLGNVVLSNKLSGKEHQIDLTLLPTASYFVTVYDKSKKIKTFKIIKN